MAELQDLKLETFARTYVDCGFNASEVCRRLWPENKDSGGMGYSLLHSPGVEARVEELYKAWATAAIKRTSLKLQKVIDLPVTAEELEPKDLARVADVQAKYLGVAQRVANADGSNLVGPVICELPAQILDGSGPVVVPGGAGARPGAGPGVSPEAEAVPPQLAGGGVPDAEGGQP